MAFGFLKKALGFVAKTAVGFVGSQLGISASPPSPAPPPPQLYPTPPVPIPAQLPYLSYSGGGLGASPSNTYAPAAEMSGGGFKATVAKRAGATRARPKKRAKSSRKPKFGTPAFRKKYGTGKRKKKVASASYSEATLEALGRQGFQIDAAGVPFHETKKVPAATMKILRAAARDGWQIDAVGVPFHDGSDS